MMARGLPNGMMPEANVGYADDGLQSVELAAHRSGWAQQPTQGGFGEQELELFGGVVEELLALHTHSHRGIDIAEVVAVEGGHLGQNSPGVVRGLQDAGDENGLEVAHDCHSQR